MPFCLRDRDFTDQLDGVRSVLIVPCRFCPAASLAVRKNQAYMEPFKNLMRTAAYEDYLKDLVNSFELRGIRAEVFDCKLPNHFILCMWPQGRRDALARRAARYDAVVVLGCDCALKTAEHSLKNVPGCRVIHGMEAEGVMNVVPSLEWPCKVNLKVNSVTQVKQTPSERSNPA